MLPRGNMTLVEKQAELLRSYLDTHGLEHDTALQRDMIARFVLQIWTRILMEMSMIQLFRGT
jgi:hypothetical protein